MRVQTVRQVLLLLVLSIPLGFVASTARASVEISTKPTKNMSCSGGVCTPTAKNAVLNVSDLAGMLASGDVTVQSGSLAQDIEIDAALSWASASRLTLDSFHAIAFDRPVAVAGTGALTITTNDGGTGGDFSFTGKGHVEFWDLTSSLVINGDSYTLAKKLSGLRQAIEGSAMPLVALAHSYNAQNEHAHGRPPLTMVRNGTVEGLGNVISNLSIDDPRSAGIVGLFSDNRGTIRDLGVTDETVSGMGKKSYVGGLAGWNEGTIQNCYTTGTVSTTGMRIGGLAGINDGTIIHSHSAAAVTGGYMSDMSGGLAGFNDDDGTILTSYATGAVSGGSFYPGGLVGLNRGAISASYATGAVTYGNGGLGSGGLVGENDGAIANSYASGAIQLGELGGGLIGINGGSGVTSSYSTGFVGHGGGFVLRDDNQTISSSYWDLDTSGVSDPGQGAGNIANDPGITGLTDAQLKSALPSGFDPAIWAQNPSINNGYPYLLANPPPG